MALAQAVSVLGHRLVDHVPAGHLPAIAADEGADVAFVLGAEAGAGDGRVVEDLATLRVPDNRMAVDAQAVVAGEGDDAVGMPAYNGGLFDRARAPLLERTRVPDAVMAPLIDALSRRTEDLAAAWIARLGVSSFTHTAIEIAAHSLLTIDLLLFALYTAKSSFELVKEMLK